MIPELMFLFFARMADMSAATLRHLFVMRGYRFSAAAIGFVEIVIYLIALGLMLQQPHSTIRIFVFGLGYAVGILVGCLIEEKLAIGMRLLQVTTDGDDDELTSLLRSEGCPVTTWQAEGLAGPKRILQVLLPRRKSGRVIALIQERVPNAFVIALEPRSFLGGLGPPVLTAPTLPIPVSNP